ncbi:SO2930 family diheme c-type cytochrome [Chondromyces apiculatus]|uniref:Cytochrome c domain-containing protein n=1 Tax=Chondromyces apiculatus DSM 436 TaxID=1192034 RepID=A0A017T901_9BACT|nr:SO2930 family diheme c-type cytochrome [Chondromyces apiculatus]EYF05432.1 Hypothetical protein CAP_3349 [Chondromyces apiculatus DSM 436]
MSFSRQSRWALLGLLGLLGFPLTAISCGGDDAGPAPGASTTSTPPPDPDPEPEPPREIPYETLSEYGFFEGPLADLRPVAGVVPYEVTSPLWADHAGKGRFIVLPEGAQIDLGEVEDWQFPVGTIIIKTFFFSLDLREPEGPARIVETRLLILSEEGWVPHTYAWNDAQTEATRLVAGDRVDVSYTDAQGMPAQGQYVIPNTNQCKSCHERDDTIHLLGLVTPQLNREIDTPSGPRNQLVELAELGMFSGALPPPADLPAFADPRGSGMLDDRARAYLHANCSHCHRPGGAGGPSGLVLLEWERTPLKNGICKTSVAAGAGTGGHAFDVEPGHPEQSIMIFRMGSTDPEIKMPELTNRMPDQDGIALVSGWIAAMDPPGCVASP